jgi:hypothetical protein
MPKFPQSVLELDFVIPSTKVEWDALTAQQRALFVQTHASSQLNIKDSQLSGKLLDVATAAVGDEIFISSSVVEYAYLRVVRPSPATLSDGALVTGIMPQFFQRIEVALVGHGFVFPQSTLADLASSLEIFLENNPGLRGDLAFVLSEDDKHVCKPFPPHDAGFVAPARGLCRPNTHKLTGQQRRHTQGYGRTSPSA